MKSMTGYGRGVSSSDGRQLTVELKSVNHRFLDISVRLPRNIAFLEDTILSTLNDAFSRGHIDVYVNYINIRSDSRTININTALLNSYVDSVRKANAQLVLPDDFGLSAALALPNVIEIIENPEDSSILESLLSASLSQAIDGLIIMRETEGARLHDDLFGKLRSIESIKDSIAQRAPLVSEEYRIKLENRIAELASGHELDAARLATEVAIFADRASIDEEIVRLTSHISAMDCYLESSEPVGANINFLVQEMNREINTIGSKANDALLTQYVISAKAVLEKIREQIQNIE